MQFDFVIVGGGIGGAVLANLLGRRGRRVLVLEKATAPMPQARPEVLWPATVAALRTLLPEELEPQWSVPIRTFLVTCGKQELLRIDSKVFDDAGVQPCSTANTRELLMQQASCEYRRGVEVMEVLRDKERIVGVRTRDTASGTEQEIPAGWTVGDDGAHSIVRQACGFPPDLRQFPLDVLGFRFDWPARLPPNGVRIWLNKDRLRTGLLGMPAAPVPQGKGVALLPIWPEAGRDAARLQEALRGFASQDAVLAELISPRSDPAGFARFRIGWSPSPRFGIPGGLLMGDAAHPVTPAGGQGANLSVADALVIAEAASERPDRLLEEYERRRLPPTMRSLSFSRSASRLLSLPRLVLNLGFASLPWLARRLNRRTDRFGEFLRTAAEAFQEAL
jgi:2-polyprenyl-6-methoxyphenol hydroxylase-like FAD-dependent oxidoreductase